MTQSLTLQDISADGRALVAHDSIRIGIMAGGEGQARERELAWLDWSSLFDLSTDGKTILFSETGEGSGPAYSTFIRTTDGAPPVRIGEGGGQATVTRRPLGRRSGPGPDKWPHAVSDRLGRGKRPEDGQPRVPGWRSFTPDGKRYVFNANEPGRGARIYSIEIPDGAAKAISPEGYRLSPTAFRRMERGSWPRARPEVFLSAPGRRAHGDPGFAADETPAGWTPDGRSLYVFRRRDVPGRVFKLDVDTGKKELAERSCPRRLRHRGHRAVILTPDGRELRLRFPRTLSDLYVVEGLKGAK